MSNSLDAVARRIEAARAAHQRIRLATAAVDAANQAVIKAQAQVGPKLRKLGIDHALDDTEYDRTVAAPIINRAGRTVVFKNEPIYQPLAEAEAKQREAHHEMQAALRARVPPGWQGDCIDAPDFISLVDVESWLSRILSGIRDLRGFPPNEDAATAVAARNIDDFYRILDHLQINERPPRLLALADVRQAEAALSELLAWVRRRLSDHPPAETMAELRASLAAVRNRVDQIAKTVSPDDYEHEGEAASHKYQRADQAAEKAVYNQLVEVLLTSFAPLADRITDTLGNDQFPTNHVPPTADELAEKLVVHFVPSFRPERLDMDLFNLQSPDLTLAGKLMLVWAKWANVPGRDRPPAYRDRSYLPWITNLVNRYREDPHTWRVLVHPFDWAIRAFDEVAKQITGPPECEPLLTPEVRAALEPLRALNEQERERDIKRAELFLLAQGWQPAAISAYLTFPTNVQKVLDAEQMKRLIVTPLPNDAPDQAQPPAAGASEQGEGAGKSRAEILKALPDCVWQAYMAYQFAETMNGKRLEDREAYDYIKGNGLPDKGRGFNNFPRLAAGPKIPVGMHCGEGLSMTVTPYPCEIETEMKALYESLNEKDRRRYAAVEATKLGRGGFQYIAGLLRCDRKTIRRGRQELRHPPDVPRGQVRKKGRPKES